MRSFEEIIKDCQDNKYNKNIFNKYFNELLQTKEVKKMIDNSNYKISNIDTYICLESPSLKEYKAQIQNKLSEVLKISPSQISIKAGTNEKMGEVGNSKAIECYAVCLLEEKNG